MTTVPSHLEITVRRPNGTVETIVHPQWKQINDRDFAKLVAGTKAAGRGEVLSYRNVTKEIAEPAKYARLAAAEKADNARRAAVYRAMDAADEAPAADRTPYTQGDE